MFWYGIKILCGVNDIQVDSMASMKDLVIQNKLSHSISIISICESKLFRNQVFVFGEAKFSSLVTNVNNEVHKEMPCRSQELLLNFFQFAGISPNNELRFPLLSGSSIHEFPSRG